MVHRALCKVRPATKNCSMLFEPTQEGNKTVRVRRCQPPPVELGRPWKCKAHFYILGVRKGGSTSLLHYISAHPAVHKYRLRGRPEDGENPHRIGSPEHGLEYERVPKHKLVADANVRRLVNDAELLGRFCPKHKPPRFFVLLRETVQQCHSLFLMRARLQSTKAFNMESNITDALLIQLQAFRSYIKSSESRLIFIELGPPPPQFRSSHNCLYETLYVLHLQRFLRFFEESVIRIYWTDTLLTHTTAVALDAMRFLGLDTTVFSPDELEALTSRRFNVRPLISTSSSSKTRVASHTATALPPNLVLSDTLVSKVRRTMAPFNQALLLLLKVDALPPGWTAPYSYVGS